MFKTAADQVWEIVEGLIDDRYKGIALPEQFKEELKDIVDDVEDLAYNAEQLAKESV